MRINQFLAQALGISRRTADKEIEAGNVRIGGRKAQLGDQVSEKDDVSLKGKAVKNSKLAPTVVMLNKPGGFVTSRKRDLPTEERKITAPTVMELLPPELQHLRPVGRLDKESSGLLLLTDDGDLIYRSTHPKFQVEKEYLVEFETPLSEKEMISWKKGMRLIDGIAKADKIERLGKQFRVTLHQGKNRQIRRMAGKTGNKVNSLQRIREGEYSLGNLREGKFKVMEQHKKNAR